MVRIDEVLAQRIATEGMTAEYLQVKPLTSDKMVEWLKKRGITFLDWKALHFLWTTGVLRPVAIRATAISDTRDIVDSSRLVPADFDQTGEYFVDLGAEIDGLRERTYLDGRIPYKLKGSLLWHPYQLLDLWRVAQCLRMNWTLDTVLSGARSFSEFNAERASLVPQQLVDEAMSPRRVESDLRLALMLLIDPVAYPRVVGKVTLTNNVDFGSYYAWLDSADHQLHLQTLGLSIDTVKSWHEDYSTRAQMSDPVEHFRVLLQHADRSDLARQLDGALFAQELYDQARIMRFYLESEFQVAMWEEDDYRGGPGSLRVKREWYGTECAADFDRQTLGRILTSFGLNPHYKANWFVEGATEHGFFTELAELTGLSLAAHGIEIHDFRGKDGAKPRWIETILRQSIENEIFTYVIIDRDKQGGTSHVTRVEGLARMGLLPLGYHIFDPDFESANFTIGELVEVGNSLAADLGSPHRITVDQLQALMTNGGKSFGAAYESAMNVQYLNKGKGEEYGRALARLVLSKPLLTLEGGSQIERPAWKLFITLSRTRFADYQASVEQHGAEMSALS